MATNNMARNNTAANSWITLAGQKAHDNLRTEMRLRLAKRLLDMTGVQRTQNGILYIDMSRLCSLFELLGELWVWFDGRERSQLTRSKNLDAAMAKVILRGVGHPLNPIKDACCEGGKRETCLELDPHVYYEELRPYDEWNSARVKYGKRK